MSFRELQDLANATLFSSVAFGEVIAYTPAGSATPVDVYAAAAEEEVLTDGDVPISSTRVVLRLRSVDIVGGPQARASIVWRGVSYRVERVDGPDDSGVCSLRLMRAASP